MHRLATSSRSYTTRRMMCSSRRNLFVRYMDETGIRKRRVVKGWTQKQVFEWEEYCENLRGNERIKGMLIVPGDKKKEK